MLRTWLAPFAAALVLSAPLVSRAEGINLTPDLPNLRLLPTGQFEDGLDLFPKGDLADDAWHVPAVATQFFSSMAFNIASVAVFSALAESTTRLSVNEARSKLLTMGIVQLLATPLLNDTIIWFAGNAVSDIHDHGWAWPLLANYLVELIVVGARIGYAYGAIATPQTMAYMQSLLPAGANWGGCGIGRFEFPMLAQTFLLGGHVRVGLEDNIFIEKGVLAKSNAELVGKAVRIVRELGGTVASAGEAREILRLRKQAPLPA